MPKVGQLVGATKVHMIVFDVDGKMKQKNLPNENNFKSVRIKIGRHIGRRGETENLDDAILEPVRASFQARRWQEAYEEVADELEEMTNMTQLLLLGKFEYTGGPIFKVVLEC